MNPTQEKIEEIIYKILYIVPNIACGNIKIEILNAYIENIISQAKKEGIAEGTNILYKVLESIKAKDPIGASQWKEYGKAMGYWQYFEEELKK